MDYIYHFLKTSIGGTKTKIAPITLCEMRYYALLQTIQKGNLLTKEEMGFVRELTKEQMLVVVKLYSINLYNLKHERDDIFVEFS